MTDWKEEWQENILGNYPTPAIQLVSGRGSILTDSEGKEYIDLLSGIGVNALGHAHPAVVEAVHRQISTLSHTSNIFAQPRVVELAHTLKSLILSEVSKEEEKAAVTKAQVYFSNSGAEANEAAIKIARLTGKKRILAAEDGFHGRTMGSLAITGQPGKRAPFEPLIPGVEFYPYGDSAALRACVEENPEDVAAIFLESIQGETGVVPPPPGFLSEVRALCTEYEILMVVDEVQAGMGRTGQWFGFQEENIMPDIITIAKGLGGGLPIGATVVMPPAQLMNPGMHGSTFGGNPISCAAGLAVIDTIIQENLLNHARHLFQLFQELETLDTVSCVRGRGAMIAIVLKEAWEGDALSAGLLLNKPAPHIIRLLPPLNLTEEEAKESLRRLKNILSAENANSKNER